MKNSHYLSCDGRIHYLLILLIGLALLVGFLIFGLLNEIVKGNTNSLTAPIASICLLTMVLGFTYNKVLRSLKNRT